MKLQTVSVPCQWATTSRRARAGHPPVGEPAIDHPGERVDPCFASRAQHRVAEVLAQHQQLIGEVVLGVFPAEVDEQVHHASGPGPAAASARAVSASRRSHACSKACCRSRGRLPKRCTSVEPARPTRSASVPNDRAAGPSAWTMWSAAERTTSSGIVRLRGIARASINE